MCLWAVCVSCRIPTNCCSDMRGTSEQLEGFAPAAAAAASLSAAGPAAVGIPAAASAALLSASHRPRSAATVAFGASPRLS